MDMEQIGVNDISFNCIFLDQYCINIYINCLHVVPNLDAKFVGQI